MITDRQFDNPFSPIVIDCKFGKSMKLLPNQ